MPVSHVIYPDRNLVYVTLEGHVTMPQVLTDHLAYTANKDFHPGQAMFVDTSRVLSYKISFQGLIAILKYQVGLLDRFDPTVLTAIYAPGDFMFEKGIQYQRLTSSSEISCVGVFRHEREAWAFLNLEQPVKTSGTRQI